MCPRFITQSPGVPVLTHKVFFSLNFRLPAYKVICSRIRHAHENAWRRLPIGARHLLHFVFVLIVVDIHVRKDTTRA